MAGVLATGLVLAMTSSASVVSATAATTAPTPANWPGYHGAPSRSGVSTTMPAASGPLRITKALKLDGAVYASPIVVGGVVVVATENDSVYAFDTAGHRRWHIRLGNPSPASQRPCGDIDPLGITGTPVYSAATKDVYLVAETSGGGVHHTLFALSLKTGKVQWRKGIDLPGPTPAAMQERGALAITGGRVWVPFGGLAGDCSNYRGRLVGVQLTGKHGAIKIDPSTHREGGIWAPPGPVVDAHGNFYIANGNGSTGPGDRYDHTDSVLEYSPAGKLVSSFAPRVWAEDNAGDVDIGSISPTLVGTKWVVQGGKSNRVYVLRQGHLGGIGGQASVTNICDSFGGSAVANGIVYLPCTDGVRALRVDAKGKLHVLWHALPAGSPVVGAGRVWSLDTGGGYLYALNPKNGATLRKISVGSVNRFATPALYSRLVIVPTMSGVTFVRSS